MGGSQFFNPSSVLAGPGGAVQGSVSCSSQFSISCVSNKQSSSVNKMIMKVFFERLWMIPIEQLHDVPGFATPLLGFQTMWRHYLKVEWKHCRPLFRVISSSVLCCRIPYHIPPNTFSVVPLKPVTNCDMNWIGWWKDSLSNFLEQETQPWTAPADPPNTLIYSSVIIVGVCEALWSALYWLIYTFLRNRCLCVTPSLQAWLLGHCPPDHGLLRALVVLLLLLFPSASTYLPHHCLCPRHCRHHSGPVGPLLHTSS